ncbi:hypothetical protein RRG08_043081 [Elysia crispata]|uniref:Uncharacterized protein n=1 Tax=Elysia crispata TaxID=231223 RepID=A0AAE1CP52_9GAST|nr:hypothetical protein RRG08_043081 [Elysia crispata]
MDIRDSYQGLSRGKVRSSKHESGNRICNTLQMDVSEPITKSRPHNYMDIYLRKCLKCDRQNSGANHLRAKDTMAAAAVTRGVPRASERWTFEVN